IFKEKPDQEQVDKWLNQRRFTCKDVEYVVRKDKNNKVIYVTVNGLEKKLFNIEGVTTKIVDIEDISCNQTYGLQAYISCKKCNGKGKHDSYGTVKTVDQTIKHRLGDLIYTDVKYKVENVKNGTKQCEMCNGSGSIIKVIH